jgi:DNA-binding transcriptional regulator YdaS (Cro superfamily)
MGKGKTMTQGLRLAIEAAGTRYRLAKLLDISPSSVLRWKEIPIRRTLQVEQATGVPREQLRPDMFRRTGKART